MSDRLEHTLLTRLLTLNNQVHDLENQLMGQAVPTLPEYPEGVMTSPGSSRIAEMQDRIAQGVRASLTACWLENSKDLEY